MNDNSISYKVYRSIYVPKFARSFARGKEWGGAPRDESKMSDDDPVSLVPYFCSIYKVGTLLE